MVIKMANIELQKQITALIEELLKLPEGTITIDTQIADVEEWDSLAHVMIIGELEERLGVSIPLDDAIELTCVRELFEKAGCL
jgi:acyl carrier protein